MLLSREEQQELSVRESLAFLPCFALDVLGILGLGNVQGSLETLLWKCLSQLLQEKVPHVLGTSS